MARNLDIHLLLARHDDHRPTADQAFDGQKTAEGGQPESRREGTLAGRRTGDVGDLRAQRWGVVAPPGDEGDRLLELIDPLIRHREQEQGAEVARFRSAPGFSGGLSLLDAFEWQDACIDTHQKLDDELPCYLLILGDLHQVPLAIQQALCESASRMVGRLAFDSEDGYRGYAEKLCQLEQAGAERLGAGAEAIFHTVKDGTAATSQGYDQLVAQVVTELRGRTSVAVRESGSYQPGPGELLAAVSESESPGVLFTLSHGDGPPDGGWASDQEQRWYQGTMSFGRGGRLDHDELLERPFLPGGIWFSQACYGAGTPVTSPYLDWIQANAGRGGNVSDVDLVLASKPLSGQPFIAHLPKAVLANREGPLAFIGHVDLAWTFSFRDPYDTAGSRSGHFARMVADLLAGHRVGQGMRAIQDYQIQVMSFLARLYADNAGRDRQGERALWWMIWQDLAGYVLLGDPAARLPVQRASGGAGRSGSAARPSPVGNIERAIARIILREKAKDARREEEVRQSPEQLERLAKAFRQAGLEAVEKMLE